MWERQPNGDWWADMPIRHRDGSRWVKPRVMDVHRRTAMRNQGTAEAEIVAEWWTVSRGAHTEPWRFPDAETAMRYADSWWDAMAAARRL